MEIVTSIFGPAIPSLSPRLLPRGAASAAVNCDPVRGSLYPLRGLRPVSAVVQGGRHHSVVPIRSRASGETRWFGRGSALESILRSPLVNDTRDRVYRFRPNGAPQVATFSDAFDGKWMPLAVRRPEAPPQVSVTRGTGDPLLRETRAYVYTCVTAWGEESAPSPPTVVDVVPGDTARLSGFSAPAGDGRPVAKFGIYRTLVSGSAVVYRKVGEIAAPGSEFVDAVSDVELSRNQVLEYSYDEPVEGLCGVRQHPSGSLVGFTGNQVRFSVPYAAHAWPEDFVVAVPDRILALEVWQQYVYVATESSVAVIYGDTPPDVGLVTFPFPTPCAAPGSMTLTATGPVLAATDGLYLMTPGGGQPLSHQAITGARWRAEVSDTTCVFEHRGWACVVADDGTGLMVADGKAIWLNLGVRHPFVIRDPYDGRTMVWSGAGLYELDAWEAPPLTAVWRSQTFALPNDAAFEAARVLFSPGDGRVRFRLWAGPSLVCDMDVVSSQTFMLPALPPSRLWTFEVVTTLEVHEVRLATSKASIGAAP